MISDSSNPTPSPDSDRIDIACAIAVIAIAVCIIQLLGLASSAYRNFILISFVLWAWPIPGFIATVSGFIGCLRTSRHSAARKAAFISLCAGMVFFAFWILLIYVDYQMRHAFTDT